MTAALAPYCQSYRSKIKSSNFCLDFGQRIRRAQVGNEQKVKAIYVTKPTCHVTLKKVVSMSITKKRVLENVNLVVYLPLSHAPNKKIMSQGILITASKVATPFKSELLSALASPRFSSRPPHLVGILATKKEDARTYAEFTKKACETLGITYELRLVGEAREGMDGEGVGIEVEEAILEVCRTRFFSSSLLLVGRRDGELTLRRKQKGQRRS